MLAEVAPMTILSLLQHIQAARFVYSISFLAILRLSIADSEFLLQPIPVCGVFYSPYLQKFLIYEDDCPSCGGSTPHFDVWIGGSKTDTNLQGVCNCEDALTPTNLRA